MSSTFALSPRDRGPASNQVLDDLCSGSPSASRRRRPCSRTRRRSWPSRWCRRMMRFRPRRLRKRRRCKISCPASPQRLCLTHRPRRLGATCKPQAAPLNPTTLETKRPPVVLRTLWSPPSQPVGEEARLTFPRARPHRRRRHLLRRRHPAHHQAHRGEQAGGGRAPRRVPAAVAAGIPGLRVNLQATASARSLSPQSGLHRPL